MKALNIEAMLAQPKLETFTVVGLSPDVLKADAKAWEGLEAILGSDPVDRWRLKSMQHQFEPPSSVRWQAEFLRIPEDEEEA